MTSRERVRHTLHHKTPDRVPIDFGGCGQTGIAASLLHQIKKYYGLLDKEERIKIIEPYQMLGEIDEKTRKFFGLDVAGIFPLKNMFGFKNNNWKEWTMFDGTPVLVPENFNTEPDESGDILMWAEGDKKYLPSAKMPKDGFYFDSIPRQKPIDETKLDPKDNTEEFGILSDEELKYFAYEVDKLYKNSEYAIALTAPGMAFGDIALVPGPFMKDPKGIRDVTEWYISIITRPSYIKEVFRIQSKIAIENLKLIYEAVGNKIDIIVISGTDFGTQNAPMISNQVYRDIYFPFQKKLNDWIHKNTTWKCFMHSCGSITPLIPDFIEAGFDILNPVQCSACNMEPAMLKERYGNKIVFWGGGVDTQKTLPFGNPDNVKKEVTEWLNTFKRGGGYIFTSIHNLQAKTPIENFVAMIDAYKKNANY